MGVAVLVLIGVGVPVVLFAIGWVGRGQTLYLAAAENEAKENCSDACTQWKARRLDRCAAEKAAQDEMDALRALQSAHYSALALAAVLTAAAIAAALVPLTLLAAIALGAAAALALAAAVVILGMIQKQVNTALLFTKRASEARDREQKALDMVASLCTPEAADTCMLNAPPC